MSKKTRRRASRTQGPVTLAVWDVDDAVGVSITPDLRPSAALALTQTPAAARETARLLIDAADAAEARSLATS